MTRDMQYKRARPGSRFSSVARLHSAIRGSKQAIIYSFVARTEDRFTGIRRSLR